MDLDLRKLRYFLAVAQTLHFGRAAESLHIAQPVLSRQIRALERELKADLFVRDRRTTELTPAGRQLLAEARPLLARATALQRRVARTAGGDHRLVVGFMPGLVVTATNRELARRHPELTIEVRRLDWARQTSSILDGEVDVAFLRLLVDTEGLETVPLADEPWEVLLPADHRLADKDALELSDLSGEMLLQPVSTIPGWPGRSAVDSDRGLPSISSVEEKLEHVAAGSGVVAMPRSAAGYYTRSDVAHVPITDLDPIQIVLAWDRSRQEPLISEYAEIAESLGVAAVMPTDDDQVTGRSFTT
ncbi:MAG TPA: LysR substrate-binding domain-containing protein [Microlunatus sp.]